MAILLLLPKRAIGFFSVLLFTGCVDLWIPIVPTKKIIHQLVPAEPSPEVTPEPSSSPEPTAEPSPSPSPSPTPTPEPTPPPDEICIVNDSGEITNPPCAIKSGLNYYYYKEAFGGRKTLSAAALSLMPLDFDTTRFTSLFSDGWSDGNIIMSALFQGLPRTLDPANILSGVNIFGVTGTFPSPVRPACREDGSPSALDCTVYGTPSNPKWMYLSTYNGRNNDCPINGESDVGSACWVNPATLLYLIPQSKLPLTCQHWVNVDGNWWNYGKVYSSNGCRALPGQYQYAQMYGGRERVCPTANGVLDPAFCWLSFSGTLKVTFGTVGSTPTCGENTNVINTPTCVTAGSGRYVYENLYGGRDTDCTADNTGLCFLTQGIKSSLEPNLVPNKLKAGVMIFGVTGSHGGQGDWGSGSHRQPKVSSQMRLTEETVTYAGTGTTPYLPSTYHDIPLVGANDPETGERLIDDDGSKVQGVDRTSWGSATCGLTQVTLDEKTAHCGSRFGSGAVWDGRLNGNASQGEWTLVTRNSQRKEVWLDRSTGMLWSSLVSTSINWCKASGANNSPGVLDAENRQVDPDGICDNPSYQNTTGDAVSACFEATGFTQTEAAIDLSGKVGLGLGGDSSPKVNWRIPTVYDFETAEYNGIRFVLPDFGFSRLMDPPLQEWTGTISSVSTGTEEAWAINSLTGEHSTFHRSSLKGVRCIGR